MRLNELQGIKSHPARFHSRSGLVDYMATQGYTALGAGGYGVVFDHPKFGGRFVLKCFSDPLYEEFVSWCMTRASDPHLPKFIGKIIKYNARYRMVRIERLTPLQGANVSRVQTISYAVMGDGQDLSSDIDPQDAGLVQTLQAIKAHSNWVEHLDLEPQNFMQRGQTVVVIDPIATFDPVKL
jgi:hypothetical protein